MVALSHGKVQAYLLIHRVHVVQEKGRRVLWPVPNPPRHRLVRTHSSSYTCPFHEHYVGHVTGKVPNSAEGPHSSLSRQTLFVSAVLRR